MLCEWFGNKTLYPDIVKNANSSTNSAVQGIQALTPQIFFLVTVLDTEQAIAVLIKKESAL